VARDTMFASYGRHDQSVVLTYLPLGAGLIASAIVAVVFGPKPLSPSTGFGALSHSITYLASTLMLGLAFLAAGGLANGWHNHKDGTIWRIGLRFCGVAAWMTPVVAFYKRDSLLASTAAVAVMAALGYRLIYDYHVSIWQRQDQTGLHRNLRDISDQDNGPAASQMFTAFASARMPRHFVSMFVGVACMQAAFVAPRSDGGGFVTLLLSAIAGLLFSAAVGLQSNVHRRRSLRKTIVHTCGLVAVMTLALTTSAVVKFPDPLSEKPARSSTAGMHLQPSDLISGIILLPHLQRTIKLVAPSRSPLATKARATMAPSAIEFSGEYWILPMGHMGPSEGALVQRAAPTEYNFNAVDRSPLMMLAKQRLHTPISVRCCDVIRVSVSNQDQQPETIALQVNLLNSGSGKVVRQPLHPVTLTASKFATLDFDFPSNSVISEFDEIEFYFHLLGGRKHRSANVDIVAFQFTRH
jgi:hypothetical protein